MGDVPKVPGKVVIAGRLRDYKRVDLALRAWPAVIARHANARLHVIGDGPEMAACRALVDAALADGGTDNITAVVARA